MSNEPFATTINRRRRFGRQRVSATEQCKDVAALGTALARGEASGFAPTCAWENLGVGLEAPRTPQLWGSCR
ncbi:MAG: hypothetical protein ACOVQ6_04625, partial [Brevundimonas sp.]